MKIYVGGLSPEVTDEQLQQAFAAFGKVETANVIMDRFSGSPRGFGFVEMPAKSEAIAAISGLNGQDLMGSTLVVNEARPQESRPRGGGGRGGPQGRRGGDRDRDRRPRGGSRY
ncbi:MAG TPA: RNA-binding protein [candidate division Zixibacteria bacterium]|jgi:RNA recognition motif-containing protein